MDLLFGAFLESLPSMLLLAVPLALLLRGGFVGSLIGALGLLASAAVTYGASIQNDPGLPVVVAFEVVAALITVPVGLSLRRRRLARAVPKRLPA